MAKATILTGKINPVQRKNLEMYPFVFFNGVSTASIDYDLSSRANGESDFSKVVANSYVKYRLSVKNNEENSNMEKRFQAIENAVRYLFWKDVKVQILINDKTVYESQK